MHALIDATQYFLIVPLTHYVSVRDILQYAPDLAPILLQISLVMQASYQSLHLHTKVDGIEELKDNYCSESADSKKRARRHLKSRLRTILIIWARSISCAIRRLIRFATSACCNLCSKVIFSEKDDFNFWCLILFHYPRFFQPAFVIESSMPELN